MATLTTCLSLIQEAAAASARRALGMNKEKVTKDNIVYIQQRADIRVGKAKQIQCNPQTEIDDKHADFCCRTQTAT